MEILSLIEEYENILCLIQDKYLLYKNQQLTKSISHSKISSLILRKNIALQHDLILHDEIRFPKPSCVFLQITTSMPCASQTMNFAQEGNLQQHT